MAFNVDTMKGRRNWAYATLGSVAALVIANKARKNRNAPPVRNCQNRQMANPDMDVMSDFNLCEVGTLFAFGNPGPRVDDISPNQSLISA